MPPGKCCHMSQYDAGWKTSHCCLFNHCRSWCYSIWVKCFCLRAFFQRVIFQCCEMLFSDEQSLPQCIIHVLTRGGGTDQIRPIICWQPQTSASCTTSFSLFENASRLHKLLVSERLKTGTRWNFLFFAFSCLQKLLLYSNISVSLFFQKFRYFYNMWMCL